MNRPLNLTDTRVEVLRYLAGCSVPVYACAIADNVIGRRHGARGFTAQQATRTGAGAVRPLVAAGLVAAYHETYGWGRVALTPEGSRVLAAFDRDDGSLTDVLAQAAARTGGAFKWSPTP